MKTLNHGVVAILLATSTGLALAAGPAPSASSAAPDGYATKEKSMGKEKTDAMAQENQRMSKCKAMKGDEKTGCEAQAKADAKEAMKKDAPTSTGDGSKK